MGVDFVLSYASIVIELINVKSAGSHNDISEIERKSLMKASKQLNRRKIMIITWDYWKEGDINYIPLCYWLLNTNDSGST